MGPARKTLFVLISVASFFLYALGVLTLRQDHAPGWALETAGPIPIAISHLVYGTPLGAVDYNLLMRFYHPNAASVQDIVAAAAEGSIPRGQVVIYSPDGLGAGSNLFATVAMWMFGIDISSVVLFYLVFVGMSVFAFVWRYRDERLVVVPLYFLVVTIMLLTPLCTAHLGIDQNPIGGNRYFVLATFLPALHIFLSSLNAPMRQGNVDFQVRCCSLFRESFCSRRFLCAAARAMCSAPFLSS